MCSGWVFQNNTIELVKLLLNKVSVTVTVIISYQLYFTAFVCHLQWYYITFQPLSHSRTCGTQPTLYPAGSLVQEIVPNYKKEPTQCLGQFSRIQERKQELQSLGWSLNETQKI